MDRQALELLSNRPPRYSDTETAIQWATTEAIVDTHLQSFDGADRALSRAEASCAQQSYESCGAVTRARGGLAFERGLFNEAERLYLASLDFAKAHHDAFLTATTLLNLSTTSLQIDHFDEALDWSRSAQDAATRIDAEDLAEAAKGNLGWAYFRLGDAERALELFVQAEADAAALGDTRDQLRWLTTTGYVYLNEGNTQAAIEAFRKALELAQRLNSKEDISDNLTNLAQAAVESGNGPEADAYAARALAMAKESGSKPDMLDAIAIQMQAAALRGDTARAVHLLAEVESAPESQESMKWASQHAMAILYESRKQNPAANAEYIAALSTFEAARAELRHDESQLPFLANASHIYDDYIRFLIAHGRENEALMWADHSRARTLSQGLESASIKPHAVPVNVDFRATAIKAGSTLLFYWLGAKESYLWAVTAKKTALFHLPSSEVINPLVRRYRKALQGSEDPLADGSAGHEAGRKLYSLLVAPAASLIQKDKPVMVLADGALSELNFETLLVTDPKSNKDHYWIEDVTVSSAPSLAMLAAGHPSRLDGKRLLLVGDAVSPSSEYPRLPQAALEMAQIAKHFESGEQVVFKGIKATPLAFLASDPEQFSYVHFVSHGVASRTDPLDSAIILSPDASGAGAGEGFKLYARDVMQHPIDARLVTISACYGSGTRSYAGEGLVGLSWAFLRAGAHNAIGALWEVSDASTPHLMDALYDGLQHGENPAVALRNAKLNLLHSMSSFRKPFYWAPFQLYTRL
jgi:CHAT domain-containing protein